MKAPCGHVGEVIIGGYVRCREGCDRECDSLPDPDGLAVPEHVDPEKTEPFEMPPCDHRSTTLCRVVGGTVWVECDNCGERDLRWSMNRVAK